MAANGVCEWDVENVVSAKGYVTEGTPIWEFETQNPGIIDGFPVASGDQVYAAIREMKENDALVFN